MELPFKPLVDPMASLLPQTRRMLNLRRRAKARRYAWHVALSCDLVYMSYTSSTSTLPGQRKAFRLHLYLSARPSHAALLIYSISSRTAFYNARMSSTNVSVG